MKTLILITALSALTVGCHLHKKILENNSSQVVEIDITIPTITQDKYGYYLTRCTCYPKKDTDYMIYPQTMSELDSLKKQKLECFMYSYPVIWLKY